ncbi:LOW QUALITY PROTEIN: blue-light photoreceptor PHR2-like, partial [Primulina tabacum]|uniref:LOW QUALITY PROTEIN: blue-light photoreceptor PHR2-like n=1 Tax=Primulina tabacum TaxID=48773 RepID=UPI003F5997F3
NVQQPKNGSTALSRRFIPPRSRSPPSHSPFPLFFLPIFLSPPKQITSIFSPTNNLRIPSQISSLSISSALSPSPTKPFYKSTISAYPLQNPLTFDPLRPSNPSGAAALRRASVVWFRNDLRVHDNECLAAANNNSMSVLPVYCFDPRDYGKSTSGFNKTGPYRATFLIESVSDLRKNLQSRGSDLVVRIGRPETVLLELVKAVGAEAVYVHKEVSNDEVKAEEKIEEVMKDEGVELNSFWGSTLYHLDDLPFKLEEMPTNYGGFKDKVKGLKVRKTIEALDRLVGLPTRGNVEPGEIPSLVDLGLNPNATMGQNGKTTADASLVGGETEALQRLKNFATECKEKPHNGVKDATNSSIYGANFSCKITPWLAMGCLSPRSMFDELKKSASSMISAVTNKKDSGSGSSSDTGMNWLMYELLWRDFFRFITRKYSSVKKHRDAPVTACTGAAA